MVTLEKLNAIKEAFLKAASADPKIALEKVQQDWKTLQEERLSAKLPLLTPLSLYAAGLEENDFFQVLVKSGIELNQPDSMLKMTPLRLACAQGDAAANIRVILRLIDAGVNVNLGNKEGYTPLMQAARNGDVGVVTVLLEAGAKSTLGTKKVMPQNPPLPPMAKQTTALMRAAYAGHTPIIRLLINHDEDTLDQTDDDGKTALTHALENGKFIAAAVLISYDADISELDQKLITEKMKLSKKELTALETPKPIKGIANASENALGSLKKDAAEKETIENKTIRETLERFLPSLREKKPAKEGWGKEEYDKILAIWNETRKLAIKTLLSVCARFDTTPLNWAAKHSTPANIRTLIKAGFNMDEVDTTGNYPLFIAIQNKKNRNAICLIKRGAKFYGSQQDILKKSLDLNDPLILKALRDRGVSLETSPTEFLDEGEAFLTYVLNHSTEENLQWLIELGANINQVGSNGTIFYKRLRNSNGTYKVSQTLMKKLKHMGIDAQFDNLKHLVSRVGHIVGLSKTSIPVPIENISLINGVLVKELGEIPISPEGENNSFGVPLVHEKLMAYCKQNTDPQWKVLADAFAIILPHLLESYVPFNIDNLSKALETQYKDKADKLTIIPTGWKKHAVGVALYQGNLIITNRGDEGDENYGTKVYPIPKEKKHLINNAFFSSLLNSFNKTPKAFFEILGKVVDLKKEPIQKFPSKLQKHGNCSLANLKSLIEAFVPRKEYKKFTHFFRETEIEYIITLLKNPPHPRMKIVALELVKAILRQHHHLPDLKQEAEYQRTRDSEMDRALRLIQALTSKELKAIKISAKQEAEQGDTLLLEALNACEGYQAKLTKEATACPIPLPTPKPPTVADIASTAPKARPPSPPPVKK